MIEINPNFAAVKQGLIPLTPQEKSDEINAIYQQQQKSIQQIASDANGQQAPAPMIIMSMATQWRGHLLAWVFTANDTGIFNEITKSLVQFGNGPWSPMFAPDIGPQGSGTPIAILPK